MSGKSLITFEQQNSVNAYSSSQQQFVTMRLDEQWFGISVRAVQDVLRNLTISRIPLAPRAVAGALNIRGRVVTAIDMRTRLNMPTKEYGNNTMYVVVEYEQELFALIVDAVGDVLTLSMREFEPVPSNFSPDWREISAGVFKLEKKLMVIIDVIHVIDGIVP